MEQVKSGVIETNFNSHHKEVAIGNVHVLVFSDQVPDLSILSADRWLIWRLSGAEYGHVMLPAQTYVFIKNYNVKLRLATWVIGINVVKRTSMSNDENVKYEKLNIPDEFFTAFKGNDNYKNWFENAKPSYTKEMYNEIRELSNHVRGKVIEYYNIKSL